MCERACVYSRTSPRAFVLEIRRHITQQHEVDAAIAEADVSRQKFQRAMHKVKNFERGEVDGGVLKLQVLVSVRVRVRWGEE